MATTKEFMEYVAEQMSDAGTITYRKMFGEYGVYCDGKLVALVCDNRLFVKSTEAGRQRFPQLPACPPYPGAKDSLLVEELDNRQLLGELVAVTYAALPEPKPKRGGKQRGV